MNFTPILIGLAVVVVIILIIGVVITSRGESKIVEERLGKYLEDEKPKDRAEPGKSALTEWVNTRVEKSSFGEKIARQLARADMKFKPGEYIALFVIAIFGVGLVAYLIGGRSIISFLIGGLIGGFLPNMYLNSQKSKRLVRFNEQLPDMLNLMVNGLRAGFSTMQSMEAVSKEMPVPICDEFRRVVQEMSLGIPMERALANLIRRIPSDDLDFVITAINVQREVGGNLAEILDIISYTIRERVKLKGEIRVLTSQVAYTGKFLAMMPFILVLVLWFINNEYIMEFFNPKKMVCGIAALGGALLMIATGYIVMQKIAKIEV
jgi:tight adherence protein B